MAHQNGRHRVAIYCRVSTSDWDFDRQERDLLERAGHEVVAVHEETLSGIRKARGVARPGGREETTEGVALALVALCGIVFCAVVVPAFFVRRSSRRDPAGGVHRLASEALRLGWGVVLTAFVLSMIASAIDNSLKHQSVP